MKIMFGGNWDNGTNASTFHLNCNNPLTNSRTNVST